MATNGELIGGGILSSVALVLVIVLRSGKIIKMARSFLGSSSDEGKKENSSNGDSPDNDQNGGSSNDAVVNDTGHDVGDIDADKVALGDASVEVDQEKENRNEGDSRSDSSCSTNQSQVADEISIECASKGDEFANIRDLFLAGNESTTIQIRVSYSTGDTHSEICINTSDEIEPIISQYSIGSMNVDGTCFCVDDYRREASFQVRFEYDEDVDVNHFVRFKHQETGVTIKQIEIIPQ